MVRFVQIDGAKFRRTNLPCRRSAGTLCELQRLHAWQFLAPLDPHRSTADKVRTLVEMRDSMYALAAPLRRGMMRVEAAAKSKTFNIALEELRRVMTQQIQQGFVKELHLNTDPYDVLPRIEAITSFEMWDHFIQVQGASRTAVRLHMTVMLLRELQPTG